MQHRITSQRVAKQAALHFFFCLIETNQKPSHKLIGVIKRKI